MDLKRCEGFFVFCVLPNIDLFVEMWGMIQDGPIREDFFLDLFDLTQVEFVSSPSDYLSNSVLMGFLILINKFRYWYVISRKIINGIFIYLVLIMSISVVSRNGLP